MVSYPQPTCGTRGRNTPRKVRLSAYNTDKLYHLRAALPSIHLPLDQQEDGTTVPASAQNPRPKPVSEREASTITELYATGISAAEVARRVGRPSRTVTGVLRRKGIEIRSCPPPVKADVNEMIRLYESGLSLAKVGKVVGVSQSTVGKHLSDTGITLRSRGAAATISRSRV